MASGNLFYAIQTLDCDLDETRTDRLVETSGETGTLKIRIPVSIDKRNCCTDESLLSKAEDSNAPSKKKKSGEEAIRTSKTCQGPCNKTFLVPVYIEIAQEPALMNAYIRSVWGWCER